MIYEWSLPKGVRKGDTFLTKAGHRATIIGWSPFQETETKEQMVLCRVRKGNYPPKMFKPTDIRVAMHAEALLRKELANA